MNNAITFQELDWDTNFFGVTCAKVVLHHPLKQSDWNALKMKFKNYEFISIVNENSESINAQLIGKEPNIFLADINIQFVKKINKKVSFPQNIKKISNTQKELQQMIEIADFKYSRFVEDPNFAKRGGNKIYHEWLKNSFYNSEKNFVISKDNNETLNGFALYSFSKNKCVIELIAVSKLKVNTGIGSSLFQAVEYNSLQKGINEILVGTQLRNLRAINFYHKVGCKQIGCHQIYHLWNV